MIRSALLFLPKSGKKDTSNIHHSHGTSNDGVSDNVAFRGLRKFQSKPSIHNADNHENSAVPNMGIANHASSLVLDEVLVM